MAGCGKRNYMDEMRDIISAIEYTKPEPEVCNVRCPPLGCPKGPCIGMCCYQGTCDACRISQMPRCPPSPEPPHCCAPSCSPVSKIRVPHTRSPTFPSCHDTTTARCSAPRF